MFLTSGVWLICPELDIWVSDFRVTAPNGSILKSHAARRPHQKPLPMKLDTSPDACGLGCYKLVPGAVVAPLAHPDMPHVPPGMEAAPPPKRRLKKADRGAKGRRAREFKRSRMASEDLARATATKCAVRGDPASPGFRV
jgi:hypothetical protein